MTIQLTTLGGLRVTRDGRELDRLLRQPSRAALLVYLAVEGRVSRDGLLSMFWPESDIHGARHSLRQAVYWLRRSLGDDWVEANGHELRVGAHVQTDLGAVRSALARGEAEAAARLYGGAFLDGVHLVDLPAWETWVDARRAAAGRAFRDACRAWAASRREAGDAQGLVEATEWWAAPDPLDDEAQHELIRALGEAGRRTDAIRQYDAYADALERDGLRPLEETVAMVELLRGGGTLPPSAEGESLAGEHGAGPVRGMDPAPSAAAPPARSRARVFSPTSSRARRVTFFGGLALCGILAALVVARTTDRTSGTERAAPVAGDFQPGEWIVLADFGSPAADPLLGTVVADALRIDLVETRYVRVMEPAEVREVLARMQVPGDAPLNADVAREVALRGGAKAVLEGDVSRAGSGYLLTAVLRAAPSGESLAAFRETAGSQDDIIAAIDRLSHRIRERAGESLAGADAAPALERITTSSLDALRLMSAATRAFDRGDYPATIVLLEEALELDPDFAMAWRRLGVTLGNTELDRGRELEAVQRAYELRHRLSPRERYLATARYHAQVTHDQDATIAAYRSVLAIDPEDPVALNNLAGTYIRRQDYDAAVDLLRRAVEAPSPSAVAYRNLVEASIARGELEEAARVVEAFGARYPENRNVAFVRFWVLLVGGDVSAARREVEPLATDRSLPPAVRAQAHDHLARAALAEGRIEQARHHFASAEEIGREVGPSFFLVRRLFNAHAEAVAGNPARALSLLGEPGVAGALGSLAPPDRWHFLRAIVLAMAGRHDEARLVLEEFDRDVPPEFHEQFRIRNESARALVLLLEGDAEGAVGVLEEIRTAARCWACYAERMGWALSEAGRLQEAAEEWETALAWKDLTHSIEWQFTQNLWTLQRLPLLYEELGDEAKALAHHRRLSELWAEADPELLPRLEHARARIAAAERGRTEG